MAFKIFGVRNRTTVPDNIRSEGVTYFGSKSMPGPYFNELIFKANCDHTLGTQDQCVTQGLADIYYASTGDFKDKDGNIVTLLDYDRINIIIDVMERDIVFPAVKLDFQCHQLTDMNGYDMTIQDEVSGRIEIDGFGSVLNISGQSNLLKTTKEPSLSPIDVDFVGGGAYNDIYNDGNFLYISAGGTGVHSYSVDSLGALTQIDTQATGGVAYGIWKKDPYVLVAADGWGLGSISVDGSGNLTLVDVDFQSGSYRSIWSDSNFIYVATVNNGLMTYTIDGSGVLTYVDADGGAVTYYDVYGNGSFIFVAAGATGLRSYSVDGSGILTLVDTDLIGGTYYGVFCDLNFIYVASSLGLLIYEADGSGNLTHISTHLQSGVYYGVYGDGNLIYISGSDGVFTYHVDADGNITYYNNNDIGTADFAELTTNGEIALIACNTDGLRSYDISYNNKIKINFTGTGTILSGGGIVTP